VNILAAVLVLTFARSTVNFYETTHKLIGVAFIVQQVLVAAVFLIRRPALATSRHPLDIGVAMGGSFGGLLLRAGGSSVASALGVWVQVVGLALWILSYLALGRSFGLIAADRGLVIRGPYRVVRHPMYLSYIVTQSGYLLQSLSVWNLTAAAFAWSCQVARCVREERLLGESRPYEHYRSKVRWRLVPGLW
jgi:protein-S-isoprenylcysteine O-methyltransferase Ste14